MKKLVRAKVITSKDKRDQGEIISDKIRDYFTNDKDLKDMNAMVNLIDNYGNGGIVLITPNDEANINLIEGSIVGGAAIIASITGETPDEVLLRLKDDFSIVDDETFSKENIKNNVNMN